MSDPTTPETPASTPADAGSAPAEVQPNSSPSTGSESPAPTPAVEAAPAPTEQPTTPETPAAPEPTLNPPTVQPPLPVAGVFAEHGKPDDTAVQPKVKKATYVDAEGTEHAVEVVAERKDGSVDIMLPATIGGYRRDAVRRRESDEQKGDYLK